MTTQINLRLSQDFMDKAQNYADKHGYRNLQDFIQETVREKLYEEPVSRTELNLVKGLIKVNRYGSEDELFKKLQKRIHSKTK
ncbi:hypothetical protein ACFLZX_01730 [Nanoarchaeota archaeon]